MEQSGFADNRLPRPRLSCHRHRACNYRGENFAVRNGLT